jgi:hypothetical protein
MDEQLIVTVEDGYLVIKVKMQPPTRSKSGSTLIVATTAGFKPTTTQVDGKPVSVSVNAFIK